MVVSTLDTCQVGQEFDSIPTHLTIAPWFNLPIESWNAFNTEMDEVVLEHRFSPSRGGDAAEYGDDGSVKVRRLNHPDLFTIVQVFPVHAAVFELAHHFDPDIDAAYSRLNYSPHVSDSSDRAITEGEIVDLSNLTVFQKRAETGRKLVKAVYLWDIING
ncbi:MAG: hypothetical protein JWN12_543 [Candidatus Saccharibacteria bacterium]|nr:hypothetical protein [Candidatus Saccharibacteria bacterium]